MFKVISWLPYANQDHRQLPVVSGVYCIATPHNGKFYIGSSKNINSRCKAHVSELKRGVHSNGRLQGSWNKYGSAGFVFIAVCSILDQSAQFEIEAEFLDKLKPFDRKVGYNICKDAASPPILTASQIKRSMKKRKDFYLEHPERWKELCDNRKGKPRSWVATDETRKKLSVALKGKKRSKAQRQRISQSKVGTKMPPSFTEKRKRFLIGRVGELAMASKKYWFISPEGVATEFVSMAESCKQRGLDRRCMFRVLKGENSHHKGWTK